MPVELWLTTLLHKQVKWADCRFIAEGHDLHMIVSIVTIKLIRPISVCVIVYISYCLCNNTQILTQIAATKKRKSLVTRSRYQNSGVQEFFFDNWYTTTYY